MYKYVYVSYVTALIHSCHAISGIFKYAQQNKKPNIYFIIIKCATSSCPGS